MENEHHVPDQPAPQAHVWQAPIAEPAQPAVIHQEDPTPAAKFNQDDLPTPVVKVFSVRGLEYGMMTLCLWIAADALLAVLLLLINGGTGFKYLAFPASLLIVTLPVFSWLFLRLKRAEVAKPELRFDPSKRRWSQITQLFSFVVVLGALIGIIYTVLGKIGGLNIGSSLGKSILDEVVILAVIGGVFVYYWIDEHRRKS